MGQQQDIKMPKKKMPEKKPAAKQEPAKASQGAFPEVMTVKQAAEYLQINDQVLYRYVRDGKVPVARMGTTIRFKKSVLDQWLETESWKSIGLQATPSGSLQRRITPSEPRLPMELD